ncbi:peptidylprolyl isomerase [Lutibacter sp.]|uniref:peptidylprolyl isomerase n=1 Tax=Lutibacter sp. TaxID=1925666 RepID=UPI00349FE50F
MNSLFKFTFFSFLIISFLSCTEQEKPLNPQKENRKKIEMITNYGTMIIELYNETPLHRDNFLNLANNKAYDSLLFHRVINKFMIQGGDPDSRNAQINDTLGNGDAPYMVKAEFNNALFHKRGALAAARDNNPEKASSAMQFYIVQGIICNDSILDVAEKFTNRNKAREFYKSDFEKKPLLDSIENAMDGRNFEHYNVLMDSILNLALKEENYKPYVMPKEYRTVYKSIGGYPKLDQNYTVFGEVIKGIAVLDSIANVKTDDFDRPINNVRIQAIKLLK